MNAVYMKHFAILGTERLYARFIFRCLQTRKRGCLNSRHETKKLKITPIPPSVGTVDSVGPPDPISNIRPVRFYVPPDETAVEKSFRLQRSEVLEWNQMFWRDHNSRYFKEKEKYIQEQQTKDSSGKIQQLSPEEMSVFYKSFLNETRKAHLQYNKEWYKKNVSLLWPAFKVLLIRLRRSLGKIT